MPLWGWILIAAGVVVVAGLIVAAVAATRRKRTARLQERFGPEYEYTVLEAGEQKAAEKELAARQRRRDELDIVPLTPESLAKYAKRWQMVQTAFVDNPSSALGDADRLVTEAMRERGYPVDDFDQQAADIYLALQSGRIEIYLGPNPNAAYHVATQGKTEIVGTVSSSYPVQGVVGITTKKDDGLVKPLADALNAAIADGSYAKVLKKWGLDDEAVPKSLINPPGLPKK